MRAVSPAVEWYRSCIHDRQRKANTLSIEIELNARDEEDPGALAEAMGCLNSAIAALEQAKDGLADPPANDGVSKARHREIPYRDIDTSEPAMEDLGHSMAPLDVSPLQPGVARRDASGEYRPRLFGLRDVSMENSLSFFQ